MPRPRGNTPMTTVITIRCKIVGNGRKMCRRARACSVRTVRPAASAVCSRPVGGTVEEKQPRRQVYATLQAAVRLAQSSPAAQYARARQSYPASAARGWPQVRRVQNDRQAERVTYKITIVTTPASMKVTMSFPTARLMGACMKFSPVQHPQA